MQALIALIAIFSTGIGQAILVLFILALILPEWASNILCKIIAVLIVVGLIGFIVYLFRNIVIAVISIFKQWTYLFTICLLFVYKYVS